jgi:hypothetical protein
MRFAALMLVVACSAPPAKRTPEQPKIDPKLAALEAPVAKPPKLVVLVVIDQLPAWAFAQKRPHLTKGFDRLLREGEWHTGQHPSAATLTAPGHALLGTGEPSATSGILGNEWFSRDLGKTIKSIEQPDGTIGAGNLRVPALGDSIAAANTGGKAIGISLKDRAAILPVGKAGTSIWYDKKTASFVSNRALDWLAKLPAIKPRIEAWTPLDAAKLAQLSGTVDDQPGEVGEKGLGTTFPHVPQKTKDANDAVFALPLGNELVFETALAAIDNEQLGADAAGDLLTVSLSAHDYVGHGWGHESWESWDMWLRLDEQMGRFLDGLDARVGKDNWAMIVTSDHGAAPLPERTGGGRIAMEDIQDAANRAAAAILGPGEHVVNAHYPNVFLAPSVLANKRERDKVVNRIILALKSFPGIELAARTVDYAGNCDKRTGEAFVICLTLDVEHSGEIFYLPRRNWILEERDERLATAHGSRQEYDRLVPVIMLAPGRTPHEAAAKPSNTTIYMVRIATVLARWLNVTPPSSLPH